MRAAVRDDGGGKRIGQVHGEGGRARWWWTKLTAVCGYDVMDSDEND